jgi:hypothetical protein
MNIYLLFIKTYDQTWHGITNLQNTEFKEDQAPKTDMRKKFEKSSS